MFANSNEVFLFLFSTLLFSSLQIHYKEKHKNSKGKCTFVPDTPQLMHVKNLSAFISEVRANRNCLEIFTAREQVTLECFVKSVL